jgi:hypothetical protein
MLLAVDIINQASEARSPNMLARVFKGLKTERCWLRPKRPTIAQ